MKKSLLALAVAGAFSGAAFAQSSVTLFGIVDTNVGRISGSDNGGSVTRVNNSGINSSRLGVRGVEDLGGGLRAGFWLEGGINTDNGTGAANASTNNQAAAATAGGFVFGRRSTVSLLGGFGEVRLGRDYSAGFWNTTVFDPFGTNGVGTSATSATTGIAGNGTTLVRISNSIGYFLPQNIGGLYGQVQWATGENNSNLANSKDGNFVGGRIGWAGGPVDVAVAYDKAKFLTGAASGDLTRINVGASFTFGPFKPMIIYNTLETDTTVSPDPERQDIEVGLVWTLGPGELRAKWAKNDVKNTSNDGVMMALGYVYNMSRRTALYGTFARYDNKGTNTNFNIGVAPGVGGGTGTGYEFGLRHSF